MASGALTVQDDGTLTVVPRPDEDTAAFEATLARFTELLCPTPGQRVYRLTAASLWRARRAGLTLEEVLQTLETASTTALPPQVRADLERWSRQIDRLTVEVDQGCLLLRTTHPLVLTAVQRHRTLGPFIIHQRDATTVVLRPDTYPALVQTFDACGYPVLDRVLTDSSDTYTVNSGGAAFKTGHLAKAEGFTNAANNQIFRVASSTGTTVVGSSLTLTDETAPPGTAKLQVIGFQSPEAAVPPEQPQPRRQPVTQHQPAGPAAAVQRPALTAQGWRGWGSPRWRQRVCQGKSGFIFPILCRRLSATCLLRWPRS